MSTSGTSDDVRNLDVGAPVVSPGGCAPPGPPRSPTRRARARRSAARRPPRPRTPRSRPTGPFDRVTPPRRRSRPPRPSLRPSPTRTRPGPTACPPSEAPPRPLVPLACLGVAAALCAPIVGAVPPRVAESGAWYQLSYPAEVAGRSLRTLFGAALSPDDYGSTWRVYTFDAEAQAYADPGIDGTLPEGRGFWFIQATGDAVELGGAEVPFALGRASPACTVPEGCRESALSGADREVDWNLVGHPFEGPVATDGLRLVVESGSAECAGQGLRARCVAVRSRARARSCGPGIRMPAPLHRSGVRDAGSVGRVLDRARAPARGASARRCSTRTRSAPEPSAVPSRPGPRVSRRGAGAPGATRRRLGARPPARSRRRPFGGRRAS